MRPSHLVRFATLPLLVLLLLSCAKPPRLFMDSPLHGTFLNATTVLVEGRIRQPGAFASLDVNGISVTPAANWSVTVPLDPGAVFNRISAVAVLNSGPIQRESAVLIVGDGVNTGFVLDGDPSPQSVALRVADTGLDQIAPIVESLSSDALDISALITDQNPIATGSMSGINYVANVVEVGFGGFGLDVTTSPTGLDTTVTITDFFLEVDLDLGFLGSCTLEVETTSADISGSYDLEPLASDPSFVDVNLVSAVGVVLAGFSSQFVSGICNDPLIGDIVNLIIGQGDIQQLMQDGFEDNLADPDGTGPLDSPLAGGIQAALAGISIAGPVGSALGGVMEAEIVSVVEEVSGLTIAADAAIYSDSPDPEAPDLTASYTVDETFPTFGATTPVGGLPYGLAFAISNSAMNQLLKTQIENGLLRDTITEFLGFPLTAGVMSQLIPEFAALPPNDPIVIELAPTIAPVFTGAPGPGGEFAEMKIAGLEVSIFSPTAGETLIALEVDLDAGIDLAFTPAGLEFSLATPATGGIDLTVTTNAVSTDEPTLIFTFQQLFPLFAGELEDAIDAFPIPSLLGLDLDPVEVAQLSGGFIGLFANLVQTPTTTIQNAVFTDQSSGDFQESGGCWLREWRHRLAGNQFGNVVSANMRGMLGADAGCTTNDASSNATMAFQIDFDVVSVPGETWTIDIDHSIAGALDRISDGYNDGIGFQDGGGTATLVTDVQGSYQIVGGASGNFDFTGSTTHISDGIGGGSNDEYAPFSGANGTTLVGTGDVSVVLNFSVQLDTFSNSNTAFPTANGDEMAIRLGKNDTIDNNFTAGSYPGAGSRNIANDGHKVSVELTSVPTP
ncbi:MAG: hypothetical protein ACR2PQ_11715 [Myxococcota bacterium]